MVFLASFIAFCGHFLPPYGYFKSYFGCLGCANFFVHLLLFCVLLGHVTSLCSHFVSLLDNLVSLLHYFASHCVCGFSLPFFKVCLHPLEDIFWLLRYFILLHGYFMVLCVSLWSFCVPLWLFWIPLWSFFKSLEPFHIPLFLELFVLYSFRTGSSVLLYVSFIYFGDILLL